jgi:hypothetical protein
MHSYRKKAGERPTPHRQTEWRCRKQNLAGRSDEDHQKPQTESRANQTATRQQFQVVIMRLLKIPFA